MSDSNHSIMLGMTRIQEAAAKMKPVTSQDFPYQRKATEKIVKMDTDRSSGKYGGRGENKTRSDTSGQGAQARYVAMAIEALLGLWKQEVWKF